MFVLHQYFFIIIIIINFYSFIYLFLEGGVFPDWSKLNGGEKFK